MIPFQIAEHDTIVRLYRRVLDVRYSPLAVAAARLRHRGDRFHCSCCGSDLRDMRDRFGENRVCWACGSMERHRLVCIWFDGNPDLFRTGMSMLHVAPERCLLPRLLAVPGIRYTGGDLGRVFSPLRVDITRLEFPDASFDAVICNHVLEHVPDDAQGMSEIRRVLKPGGWALLLVPDVVEHGDVTDEDHSVKSAADRLARFARRTTSASTAGTTSIAFEPPASMSRSCGSSGSSTQKRSNAAGWRSSARSSRCSSRAPDAQQALFDRAG